MHFLKLCRQGIVAGVIMNSIEIKTKQAFLYYSPKEYLDENHQDKLDKFLSLVNTCNVSLQQVNQTAVPGKVRYDDKLCFVDLYGQNWLNNIPKNILKLFKHSRIVLFNVKEGAICEKQALLVGIHGVLYTTDRADIILKGIERIKKGERWFKRGSMNLALGDLLKSQSTSLLPPKNNSNDIIFDSLTRREKMILNLLSNGAPNKEIADSLHISPNTVKTHIYSIFRKTSSRNRVELMALSIQSSTKYALT